MRYIIISILFVLILSAFLCCNNTRPMPGANKDYQRNWAKFNLKGKVKSIKEVNYKQSIPDNQLINYVTKEYFFFDPTGNATRIVTFLENESFHTDYHYTYDEADNYIGLQSYGENGTAGFRATYAFDEKGRLYDMAEYKPDLKLHRVYKFEEVAGGYVERSKQLVPASQREYVRKYMMDSLKGEYIEETYFDGLDAPPTERKVSLVNKKGNVVARQDYDRNGDPKYSHTYQYNERNQCTYRKMATQSGLDPDFNFEERWTYDSQGNVTSYQNVNAEGISNKSYRAKYRYDQQGNWIRKETVTWDDAPRTELERQIEYYP